MPSEAVISAELSKSLTVLEPGLKLIEVNHKLPSRVGVKGFIDILARDRFKNFVIIELKRSDQSARDAFHELLKYMPLFREHHGVQAHQVRCFIVSTTWRELLVPYSEFRRLCESQTEGFEINVDAAGRILDSRRIDVRILDESPSIFEQHSVFLYKKARARSKAARLIRAALDEAGAVGYFLLHMNYSGNNEHVIYPFAAYVVPTKVDAKVMKRLAARAKKELGEDVVEPTLERNYREDSFLACISEAIAGNSGSDDFTVEIGSAMKFAGLVDNLGWTVTSIDRKGPFESRVVTPDSDVIDIIKGFGGANPVSFERLVTPAHKLDWKESQKAASNCLADTAWAAGYNWFIDRIDRKFPEGIVLARVFNPRMLPEVLYHLATHGDPSYIPILHVEVSSPDGQKHESLLGTIVWNGKTKPKSVRNTFSAVVGGFDGYYMSMVTGTAWSCDERLMKNHGLKYGLWRIGYETGKPKVEKTVIVSRSGRVRERKSEPKPLCLTDFIEANKDYIMDLIKSADARVMRV